MHYSQKVVLLAKRHDLTPYAMAKQINLNPNAATNWFKRSKVPEKYAIDIADLFEVDLRKLLDPKVSFEDLIASTKN